MFKKNLTKILFNLIILMKTLENFKKSKENLINSFNCYAVNKNLQILLKIRVTVLGENFTSYRKF